MSGVFPWEPKPSSNWLKEVNSGDLPEVYQEMVSVIGLKPTMALAQLFSGNSIYFPKLDRSLLMVRNQMIRKEFNGANTRALAHRWGLSARHVRHIVNPSRPRLES